MVVKPGDIKIPPARPPASESFSSVSERSTSTSGPIPREESLPMTSGPAVPTSGGLFLGPAAIQDGFDAIHPLQLSHGVSQMSLAPVMPPDLRDSIQAMPDLDYGRFPSCGMYSSSCSSPMSDLPYPQNTTPQLFPYGAKSLSISSTSSMEHTWDDLDTGLPANGHFRGAFDDEGSFLPPVGTPAPSLPLSRQSPDFLIEPSLPVSVSCIDGDEHPTLWRPLVDEEDALFQIDMEQIQHYLECYRKYFDPFFPIIHYPTTKAVLCQRRLVAAAMIAIGAQFSSRENAKPFSASLHDKCINALAKVRIFSPLRLTYSC